MKREPVLIVMSVLAGLQILTAGAALADVIGPKSAALAVLTVAAGQGGMQFYVRGQVTPVGSVVAYETRSGTVVAGDAYLEDEQGEDVPAGTPVDVTPTDLDNEGLTPGDESADEAHEDLAEPDDLPGD